MKPVLAFACLIILLTGCSDSSADAPSMSAPATETTPSPSPSPTHTFTTGEVTALARSGYSPYDPEAQEFVDNSHNLCESFANLDELDALTALMSASKSKLRQVHDIAEYICEDKTLTKLVEARQKGAIPDGDYYVGKKSGEIRPGTYRTMEGVTSGSCYWSRLRKNGDIIDNDLIERAPGGVRITVSKTDYRVTMKRCGIWVPSK